jgi:sterol desaturase/sphingolipid hydroxylase (fatty acid hydroxylase superfamily)
MDRAMVKSGANYSWSLSPSLDILGLTAKGQEKRQREIKRERDRERDKERERQRER